MVVVVRGPFNAHSIVQLVDDRGEAEDVNEWFHINKETSMRCRE